MFQWFPTPVLAVLVPMVETASVLQTLTSRALVLTAIRELLAKLVGCRYFT